MEIEPLFEQLGRVNAPTTMTCPKCGYQWEIRTREPKKCPVCQVSLYKSREPWPQGYEMVNSFKYKFDGLLASN